MAEDSEPTDPDLHAGDGQASAHGKRRGWRQIGAIRPLSVAIAAVAITAMALRPGATSIGPLLAELQWDLGIDSTQLGVLTALPGFAFALVGFFANRLTPRLGLIGALLLATASITVGLLGRVLVGNWGLFLLLSFVALAGMAVGNVILPAFIKASFPRSTTAMSTVYTTFLAIGSTLPTAFGIPMIGLGAGFLAEEKAWRFSLGFWFIIPAVATALWVVLQRSRTARQQRVNVAAHPVSVSRLLRSPTAIALMVFFGAQSMQAYIQFGWIAQVYRDGGLPASNAGAILSIITLGGIPGALIMPRIVAKGKGLRPAIILFGVLLFCGYLGIAYIPTTTPWLWALCLSLSGFAFPTALAMIIARTREPSVTSAVSGFVQPVGYVLSGIGPMLVGWGFGITGNWKPILWVLAITSVILVAAGLIAARDRVIDDEIDLASDTRN